MNTKRLVIPIVLLMAAPLAWASRAAERPDSPALIEHVTPIPGQVGVDSLSVWVLETHNPPVPELGVSAKRQSQGRGWFNRAASVANRNRNPLNIKVGFITRHYIEVGQATVSGISPLDGGHFLEFDSPETGFRAAVALLMSTPYRDLDLEGVFRRWSNNGFGAEILARTQIDPRATISQLRAGDLKLLLSAMAAAEGYQSSTIDAEIAKALAP